MKGNWYTERWVANYKPEGCVELLDPDFSRAQSAISSIASDSHSELSQRNTPNRTPLEGSPRLCHKSEPAEEMTTWASLPPADCRAHPAGERLQCDPTFRIVRRMVKATPEVPAVSAQKGALFIKLQQTREGAMVKVQNVLPALCSREQGLEEGTVPCGLHVWTEVASPSSGGDGGGGRGAHQLVRV